MAAAFDNHLQDLTSHSNTAAAIIDIIFEYSLHKFDDVPDRLALGRPKFCSVVQKFIEHGKQVEMCLPAFPFKSANKVYKVLGILPDKAEELALERLETMCRRIQRLYSPGATLTIISDGLVYNDLLGISDRDTWAYGEALRAMAQRMKLKHIQFSRIRDLVDFPGPKDLNEITYVASATNFRRCLLNQHGKDDIDIEHEINTNSDTMMTYLGYRRFLVSDLQYIFPLNDTRSKTAYKRNVKFLAQEMLIRGYAFAAAVKAAFPSHLRLSIHQSTGEHKISISLLNTKSGYTTPWHCTIALMADGEWLSAPKGDFEQDSRLALISEDGRPSYFSEQAAPSPPSPDLNHTNGDLQLGALGLQDALKEKLDESSAADDSSLATQSDKIAAESHNVFQGSTTDPQLDPTSESFSAKAWLKTLIAMAAERPNKFPRRFAGVAFRSLSVHALVKPTNYQRTFGNALFATFDSARKLFVGQQRVMKKQILRDFDGLVKSGEMLLVLGAPGSGCSTLLKTISGELDGLQLDQKSYLNYQGIPREMMHDELRGECIYQAETDVHFPQLTVGQTLDFAARCRAPQNCLPEIDPDTYAKQLRDVVMKVFGLSHTVDTMVGNEFVRGVSGGEKKRVSIAEAAIAGSPLQSWDNSTRGLDSATALDFVRTIRMSTELTGSTAVVSLYQVSQQLYDTFDHVTVLYEGQQIYFGSVHGAKQYFENMGFECLPRQVTADFVTSVTNPDERKIRAGFQGRTPRTADEFAKLWRSSEEHASLLRKIDDFDREYPLGGPSLEAFKRSRQALQAKSQRPNSPYVLSLSMQVKLCIQRGYLRLRGDMGLMITGIVFQTIMALVIGSVFYNLSDDTSSLYSRGVLLFFAILLAAFASALEILTLYAQRPIVEKHFRYAFYHPFAEAVASMICDLPNKIFTTLAFDLTLYFMTNLRRTPGHFFVFLLFTLMCTLTMSMYFRSIAALSKTLAQAMAPASVFSLALVIYTGFAIPTKYMRPWFRWLSYLNPVSYAFEALMINEFHDRRIPCSRFVPQGSDYGSALPSERICATTGAGANNDFVDGDQYLAVNFQYDVSHLWRNLGIMIALMVFGCGIYLTATEYIRSQSARGEVLLFRRGHGGRRHSQKTGYRDDEEAEAVVRVEAKMLNQGPERPEYLSGLQQQTAVLHWEDLNFDLKLKKGEVRRLLHDIDGWVMPGTLTALMGVSGAGKTTLLDVLAGHITIGVVGDIMVDGRPRNISFQRKTGYAKQQDLHLPTSTVREALTFSALLRQPASIADAEKLAYVDEVVKILEMESYVDAVIGVEGEALNVEQRKRLTIGVELAARPALLLFLDEPTSGLDSQTAWSIITLLRKLANDGQAILCTLHQPSAELFQTFDRLLYLAKGGKPIYFGEVGPSSTTVTGYLESKGARPCTTIENPAEYILEVTGEPPSNADPDEDWPELWQTSDERKAIKEELALMKKSLSSKPESLAHLDSKHPYAAPFHTQLKQVLYRNFQQHWRTPSYLYSKLALCLFSSLFIGFSFYQTPNTLQGLQNQMFTIFLLLTIMPNLTNQIMPHSLARRQLYEARESSSKTYSWPVFVLADTLVEMPWNMIMALVIFLTWYYPIGLPGNAEFAGQATERGALMFLFILALMAFAGTFTSMALAAVATAEAAGNIVNLLFSLSLIFCGVLATPQALPGFWIFMYRISPFTYMVSGVLSVGLANAPMHCAPEEYLRFSPPPDRNCSAYLESYIDHNGGYLTSESMASMIECVFCTGSETNTFLRSVSADYENRWMNLGIFWVYVVFNMAAAVGLYWLARVRGGKR